MLESKRVAPASSRIVIDVQHLNAWYDGLQALFGVSFQLHEGEVIGLTGRNGAGKTTTLRTIMGLIPENSGSVTLMGQPARGMRPSARARLGIGFCPEDRAIFSSLTVKENLALPPTVGRNQIGQEALFELFPNLRSRLHHYGDQLSGGEQQMLAIGRILRAGATVLLLDEPTEGLAPVIVKEIERALRELKRRGYTILLVEQNLDFVLRLADRVIVIDSGVVVDEAAADAASARERLAEQLAL